jgi:hypothetical protein
LAAAANSTHQWTIQGTKDALARITAAAQTEAYGETFASAQASATLDIDSTPPVPAISCPGGFTSDSNLAVHWSATDLSSVTGYDVVLAADGGAFLPWLTNVTRLDAIYPGQVGHTYRFSVRATDALGNTSGLVACNATTIQPAQGGSVLPPPPTVGDPLPGPARLKLSRAALNGRTLVASGRLAADATGTVRVAYSARGRTVRGSASVRHARFRLTLRLGRTIRRWSPGVLRLSYSGDARHSAQRLTHRMRR